MSNAFFHRSLVRCKGLRISVRSDGTIHASCTRARLTPAALAVACRDIDVRSVRALIIGPHKTPYEFGFYEVSGSRGSRRSGTCCVLTP